MACPFTAGGRRAAPQSGRGLSVDHLEGESERAPGRARRRGPVVRPKSMVRPYKLARGFSTAVGRGDRRTKRGRPCGAAQVSGGNAQEGLQHRYATLDVAPHNLCCTAKILE